MGWTVWDGPQRVEWMVKPSRDAAAWLERQIVMMFEAGIVREKR